MPVWLCRWWWWRQEEEEAAVYTLQCVGQCILGIGGREGGGGSFVLYSQLVPIPAQVVTTERRRTDGITSSIQSVIFTGPAG